MNISILISLVISAAIGIKSGYGATVYDDIPLKDRTSVRHLIYPVPAEMHLKGGTFKLSASDRICCDNPSRNNAEVLKRELKAIGVSSYLQPVEAGGPCRGGIALYQASNLTENETTARVIEKAGGYHLSISDEGVRILGTDSEGQFAGLLTLFQLIDLVDWTLPKVEISDGPELPFRGLRGHFPKDNPLEIEQFRRIVRAMTFCRLNQLWIRDLYVRRFPASLELKRHPELNDDDAISQSLARDLIEYARRYNVRVMGSVSSTSDIAWSFYPELIEMRPGEHPESVPIKNEKGRTPKYRFGARFNFCPSAEQTYKLLFDIIDEMVPLFTSEVFDLGIDEVSQYENGSRWVADDRCQGKDPVRLFAEYTNRLADYVTAKGKIPLVNSTPFIQEHGGDFHSIYESVGLIRKNIIINNWSEAFVRERRRKNLFYRFFGKADFSSTVYFADHGLKKILHMVAAGNRWKDRPELLEKGDRNDFYGAFITHYTYMTGEKLNPQIIEGMSFSGNHFWSKNKPVMNSKEDNVLTRYAGLVVKNLLGGGSYLQAIRDAKFRLALP